MTNTFRANSIRLMRFLYSLGFDKTSEYIDGKETWVFQNSEKLNEALAFFFYMRKQIQE